MKATDLMCGDLVLINGTPHKIQAIDNIDAEIQTDDDLYYIGEDRYHSEDKIEGIPLTKEMLDANGFRYENENNGFGTYFCSRIESRDSAFPMYIYVRWVESSEGRTPIGIYCAERENSKDNAVTIRREFYVHTLQHALRLVGLSEIADNFKI